MATGEDGPAAGKGAAMGRITTAVGEAAGAVAPVSNDKPAGGRPARWTAVAGVAAARAGRMDLRWRPTVVALSLAGVLSGAGLRYWKDWLAIDLFFVGPLWLALLVYALLRIPPYDPPPRR